MKMLHEIVGLVLALGACGGSAADAALEGTTELSLASCDPAGGTFSLEITNPYLPFHPGQKWILEGEDGGDFARVEITVLDETNTVAGIVTRVVEEREWVAGELVEVSRNYVAQAADGAVCYFGEDVDDYENNTITGHDGAWLAGDADNLPGILMPGTPRVGTSFSQERAPGIAEDASVIVSIGDPFTVPAGTFEDTLEAHDVDPRSGTVDPKRYARGVGLIVDEDLALVELER